MEKVTRTFMGQVLGQVLQAVLVRLCMCLFCFGIFMKVPQLQDGLSSAYVASVTSLKGKIMGRGVKRHAFTHTAHGIHG